MATYLPTAAFIKHIPQECMTDEVTNSYGFSARADNIAILQMRKLGSREESCGHKIHFLKCARTCPNEVHSRTEGQSGLAWQKESPSAWVYTPHGFFFSHSASSRSFLGATAKLRWPMEKRIAWERKKKERASMFTELLLRARFCARVLHPLSLLGPQNIPEGGHHFSHWKDGDGATEALGSEGDCPRLPSLSVVFGQSRSSRLQSPCGFQSFLRRGQNPRQSQNLRVASRSQENAVGGEKKTEIERKKSSPKWAVGFRT